MCMGWLTLARHVRLIVSNQKQFVSSALSESGGTEEEGIPIMEVPRRSH